MNKEDTTEQGTSAKKEGVPAEPHLHVKASGNAILVSPRQVLNDFIENFYLCIKRILVVC